MSLFLTDIYSLVTDEHVGTNNAAVRTCCNIYGQTHLLVLKNCHQARSIFRRTFLLIYSKICMAFKEI